MQTPVLKGVVGGWWHVEKASTESESQMTGDVLKMQMLYWSGILNRWSLFREILERESQSKRVQWINKYLKQKLGEYWADELFIWGGETTGIFIFFEDEELDPHTETQHH